jgi:RNA polymerase sigma-70 factor, ECF subfamily
MIRLCWGMLGNRDDAEDAAQEAFLRVFQNLEQFSRTGSFWPWARRIAINVCLRRLPARKLTESIDDHADRAATPGDPVAEEVLRRIKSEDLWRMVDTVPATYRAVIVLRYSEGLSVKEIAAELDETITTVHIRLHRAKTMLRDRMVAIGL